MHRKNTGNIYEEITSIENIKAAIIEAGKTKKNHMVVRNVTDKADYFAAKLKEDFHISGKYRFKERADASSGKMRTLTIPPYYPDQIVQHAVVRVVEPFIMKKITHECCCSIIGRGSLYASKLTRQAISEGERYYVKFDIHHYFQSVDHQVMKDCLRAVIKDKRALSILDEIIDSVNDGIPIGNYTSQCLANLYLTPLDRFIKEKLKIRHYVRYMDDFVIFGTNRRKLSKYIPQITDFVENILKLETHHNEKVELIGYTDDKGRKHGRPIDFVGYRHFQGYTTIRRRIWKRVRRSILRQESKPSRKRASRLACYMGYIYHSNSRNIYRRYYDTIACSLKLLKGDTENGREENRSLA